MLDRGPFTSSCTRTNNVITSPAVPGFGSAGAATVNLAAPLLSVISSGPTSGLKVGQFALPHRTLTPVDSGSQTLLSTDGPSLRTPVIEVIAPAVLRCTTCNVTGLVPSLPNAARFTLLPSLSSVYSS